MRGFGRRAGGSSLHGPALARWLRFQVPRPPIERTKRGFIGAWLSLNALLPAWSAPIQPFPHEVPATLNRLLPSARTNICCAVFPFAWPSRISSPATLPIALTAQPLKTTGGRASDKRAEMTYKDAEATFHEAEQIQAHLKVQDDAISTLLDKLQKLEATGAKS